MRKTRLEATALTGLALCFCWVKIAITRRSGLALLPLLLVRKDIALLLQRIEKREEK